MYIYLFQTNTHVYGWDKWLDSSERLWGKRRKSDINLSNLLNLRIIFVTFPPDLYPGTSIGFAGIMSPALFFSNNQKCFQRFPTLPISSLKCPTYSTLTVPEWHVRENEACFVKATTISDLQCITSWKVSEERGVVERFKSHYKIPPLMWVLQFGCNVISLLFSCYSDFSIWPLAKTNHSTLPNTSPGQHW